MLARAVLALAPCVLCLGVLALGVELAVDGAGAVRLSVPMRLLVRLRPDQMLADCARVLRAIVVDALGGEFDRANTPTGLVEQVLETRDETTPPAMIDRLDDGSPLQLASPDLMILHVPPPVRILVVLRRVGGRGVDHQGVAPHLTLRRGIRAVLYVGIRGGTDRYILGGLVGVVGGPLLRPRVLDSWCLLVVSPRVC